MDAVSYASSLQGITTIFNPSGIVVLMMTMKGYMPNNENNGQIQWAWLIIEIYKHCKNNILDSNMVSHHDSHGRIYAFGHQGVFKKVNNSTVGLYEIKKDIKMIDNWSWSKWQDRLRI